MDQETKHHFSRAEDSNNKCGLLQSKFIGAQESKFTVCLHQTITIIVRRYNEICAGFSLSLVSSANTVWLRKINEFKMNVQMKQHFYKQSQDILWVTDYEKYYNHAPFSLGPNTYFNRF